MNRDVAVGVAGTAIGSGEDQAEQPTRASRLDGMDVDA
jgi:hypothetical protein